MREIRADPCYPDSLFYRYDFDDDLSRIVVNPSCGVNMKEYELTPCYNSSLPLKQKKVVSLQRLVTKLAIPSKYHPFCMNLIAGVGTEYRESDHDFSESEEEG